MFHMCCLCAKYMCTVVLSWLLCLDVKEAKADAIGNNMTYSIDFISTPLWRTIFRFLPQSYFFSLSAVKAVRMLFTFDMLLLTLCFIYTGTYISCVHMVGTLEIFHKDMWLCKHWKLLSFNPFNNLSLFWCRFSFSCCGIYSSTHEYHSLAEDTGLHSLRFTMC